MARGTRLLLGLSLVAAASSAGPSSTQAARDLMPMAALPAAPTPGKRLALGFASVVQHAVDALATGDLDRSALQLTAARRLAQVLDATAPIPRAVQRLEWIDAVRAALDQNRIDDARALLGGADEQSLSKWAAPDETSAGAADSGGSDLLGALVTDATGAKIGEVESVHGDRIVVRPGRTLRRKDVFASAASPGEPRVIAAPQLNPRALRVCADPNNLPFSDEHEAGFENALAKLIARELGAELQYTWWPERRGFLRRTLQAHRCDLVMGLPIGHERVLTTEPVYRSSYVFVYGPNAPRVRTVSAPELRRLRIGVPLVGDDGANPPVVDALVRQGLVDNLRGYSVYGDYRDEGPSAELIRAVGRGDVDLAVAWGPLAGYYAKRMSPPLEVGPLMASGTQLSFDIALAVRRDDAAFHTELQAVLGRRRAEVQAILDRYDVPR